MDQTPHVILLASPGMGHLIPLLAFAKQLHHHHHHHEDFNITVVMATAGPPPKAQKALLQTLPQTIKHIVLPPADLPKGLDDIESRVFLTVACSLSSLRDTLASLTTTTRLVALVVDPFGLEALDVAKELGVPQYVFFPSTAMVLLFSFHLPTLDQMVTCEYRDLPEPIKLPGCVPVHGRDLLDPVQDRSHPTYNQIVANSKRIASIDGIILNSFVDMEEGAIKALQTEEPGKPPVYPVGPLVQTGSSEGGEGSECLQWLDSQPSGSVLFVSFGSGGTLSRDQINELALGLEMSGQKFLWVVRSPDDKSSKSAYLSVDTQNDPLSFLPRGFLERTKGQGLLVPNWAPQMEVLSHGSTGGFLTHCGWNSTLESVVNGVPLIAWPLYAEQKMNAVMLGDEGLNVALRPKNDENGLVGREEIAKVVKTLMEGEGGQIVRSKMKCLKDAAAKVLSEDGSSTKSLSELACKWKN